MKKRNLASLAVLGITAGVMVTSCQPTASREKKATKETSSAVEHMSPDMEAFYSSLSAEGQKKFDELDAQHKMMAIEMANQTCKGKNKCKGMGGCATKDNACAGQNGCSGEGGPPVKNPNKAVDIQYNKQLKNA